MANFKILLVEDDQLEAKTTKEYLEAAGHEVVWVENGTSAIKSAKTQSFDLIVLDLVLPDLEGKAVCRWIKSNEDTKDIPIIMLSAKGTTKEKVSGLKAGADDYLLKPYDPSELKARIYACLRTKVLQDELRERNRQLEEVLSQMEVLAMTDQLTGLFNRRYFLSVIEKEFSRSERYKHPTSCLMADIDHFKNINDEYGHDAGDQVLKAVAQLIKDGCRHADTVARWGGEEFIVLLPETTKKNVLRVASRLVTSIAGYEFLQLSQHVTVSIGLAGIPDSAIHNAEQLINAADRGLLRAKADGRNRVGIS